MKINASVSLQSVLILGGIVGGYFLFKKYGHLFNPASPDNIVNQGVTSAVSSAVGYEETLGGAASDFVFRLTHWGRNVTQEQAHITADQVAKDSAAKAPKSAYETFIDNLAMAGGTF